MRLLFAILLLVAVVFGAPASPSLEDSLRVLQEQVATLQKEIQGKNEPLPANSEESRRWQPEKRMVAWQPMKRTVNVDERAPLLHAIEARLSEVLRAGERLGVSADEVLADLRVRNSFNLSWSREDDKEWPQIDVICLLFVPEEVAKYPGHPLAEHRLILTAEIKNILAQKIGLPVYSTHCWPGAARSFSEDYCIFTGGSRDELGSPSAVWLSAPRVPRSCPPARGIEMLTGQSDRLWILRIFSLTTFVPKIMLLARGKMVHFGQEPNRGTKDVKLRKIPTSREYPNDTDRIPSTCRLGELHTERLLLQPVSCYPRDSPPLLLILDPTVVLLPVREIPKILLSVDMGAVSLSPRS